MDSATRLLAHRYMLGRELGRGGMGVVHEAVDRRLDRRVAVKVVPVSAAHDRGRDRFVQEARSAAGFFHPNAVAVFDAGEADGVLYIVMELVDGRTLADALAADGPVEPTRAGTIASSVLAALAAAHAAGIVHRDVKPSNIMVARDGTVKLLDFGIARRLADLANSVTAAGDIVGTPKYLAPEQVAGQPATPATDLYAVGVVLYEMLAGRAPFVGDTPTATALAHVNAPVPDVRALRHDVPVPMATTIRTAMAKDPAGRFDDAVEMQAALNGSGTGTQVDIAPRAVAPEPTQVMTQGSYRSAKPPAWWLVGVAALVLAAGSLLWFLSRDGAGDPPTAASPTTLPATTVPTTIEGVIAAFQADPDLYGRQHTATIVDELVRIQRGDDASVRAAGLLEAVGAWVESGEVTAAALALLEPVLAPLIQPAEVDIDDDAGNGNGNGGNGNGNNGNGNNGNGNENRGNGNGGNGSGNRGNGNGNGRNG